MSLLHEVVPLGREIPPELDETLHEPGFARPCGEPKRKVVQQLPTHFG